jgi:tetratricopeptide (TPR) repeat protein
MSSATELDPYFSSAYGMAAWCYVWRKLNGWLVNGAQETAEGARLARRAVECGRDDAIALCRAGHAIAFLIGDVEGGTASIDRARALNPNLATAWYLSGWVGIFRGEPEIAIEHFAHAMRLSPLDPVKMFMQTGTALAHMLAGRFDDSSSWVEKPYRDRPDIAPIAAVATASHALGGRMKEAQEALGHLRRDDPARRVSNLKDWYPLRRPEDLARYAEGLRKAGLPE